MSSKKYVGKVSEQKYSGKIVAADQPEDKPKKKTRKPKPEPPKVKRVKGTIGIIEKALECTSDEAARIYEVFNEISKLKGKSFIDLSPLNHDVIELIDVIKEYNCDVDRLLDDVYELLSSKEDGVTLRQIHSLLVKKNIDTDNKDVCIQVIYKYLSDSFEELRNGIMLQNPETDFYIAIHNLKNDSNYEEVIKRAITSSDGNYGVKYLISQRDKMLKVGIFERFQGELNIESATAYYVQLAKYNVSRHKSLEHYKKYLTESYKNYNYINNLINKEAKRLYRILTESTTKIFSLDNKMMARFHKAHLELIDRELQAPIGNIIPNGKRCPVCGHNRYISDQLQIKKGDESITVYNNCANISCQSRLKI